MLANYLPRLDRALLLPALMLVVGLALTELARWQEQDRLLSDRHEQVMAVAATLRAGLESELNSTLHLASGLAAYIQASNGHPDSNQLQSMLKALFPRGRYLRNIGVAPANRLDYIYPHQGNEKALGIHYPDLPSQWPIIAQAIASRQPILAGPTTLVQGGMGLIYRQPVFLDDGRYWGLISTVFDADRLLRATLPQSDPNGLALALRGKDGQGARGLVFLGSSQLFAHPGAVVMDIAVTGGHWQLALQPQAAVGSLRLLGIRLAGWAITLLLSYLTWRTGNAHRIQQLLSAKLRSRNEKLRGLYALSPLGIALMDEEGRYLEVNDAFCRITGYTETELRGLTHRDLTPAEYRDEDDQARTLLGQQGRYGPREKEYIRKDKSRVPIQVSGALVRGIKGGRYLGVIIEDISQRKAAEAQIHLLAFYDPLTNLPNRRLLMDRLGHALAASSRNHQYGALLFIDLDNFKTLNDTRGHDIGDRLLIAVAKRLLSGVRESDTVARLGGDEFVIMLEDLGSSEIEAANQAGVVAEKVRDLLTQAYHLEDKLPSHHSAASIGISLYLGQDESVDTLLKQADVALYQAKGGGRNAIRFYSSTMQTTLEGRAKMEHGLRKALVEQEFELYYQPQFDAVRGLTGAEALLRWRPDGGEQVAPDRFIPIAEDTGLILPIGFWVLDQACAQLARWQALPKVPQLQLAVNISSRQFRQPHFVQQVEQVMTKHGIRADGLKLELTESLVLDDVEDVIGKMQALRQLGVSFSLDDFGTGYSSLSYLRRLPIDQLKIDKSFIHDICATEGDGDHTAIIQAIISMSHSLHLQVIAEGVETQSQQAFLARNGCDNYQGYLFGRPMQQTEFEALLHK